MLNTLSRGGEYIKLLNLLPMIRDFLMCSSIEYSKYYDIFRGVTKKWKPTNSLQNGEKNLNLGFFHLWVI
jgi:hypothetical protein